MSLLIASATPKELAAALRDAPELAEAVADVGDAVRRTAHGREFILLAGGVGPVNAALAAGRALAPGSDVEGVILVGLAGTFDVDRAPVGSIAAASCEIFPEYGLRSPEGVDPRGIGFSQGDGDAGQEVWDVIDLDPQRAASRMGLALPDCAAGPSITVAGVTSCDAVLARYVERYRPLTENMEGFSWALAAARAGVPFLELRAVSNMVGSRSGWNIPAALETMAGVAAGLLWPGRELAKGR